MKHNFEKQKDYSYSEISLWVENEKQKESEEEEDPIVFYDQGPNTIGINFLVIQNSRLTLTFLLTGYVESKGPIYTCVYTG